MPALRLFRHYIPTSFLILGLIEAMVLVAAIFVGVEIRFLGATDTARAAVEPLLPKAITYAVIIILSMSGMGLYGRRLRDRGKELALRIAGTFILAMIPLSVAFYLFPGLFLGRGALANAFFIGLAGILIVRYVFFRVIDQQLLKRRVLVLGTGNQSDQVRKLFGESADTRVEIVGYVHMPGENGTASKPGVLTPDVALPQFAVRLNVDELVVAVDDRRKALPVNELLGCKLNGIEVLDLGTFFERETGKLRLDLVQPSWMFFSDGFRQGIFKTVGKRVFDVFFSLLLLPLALPAMVLVALAVWIDGKGNGSILYRQTRVGEGGVPFTIYKFRSMHEDAESDGVARWASKNDARVTAVGAFLRRSRLDELPQIFNVLKGDMSLVGPRPERPEFVAGLEERITYFAERHRVKPGVTGWAQVCYQYGSSEDDASEKLQYDLYYVKNYSMFLDLLILLQTAEVMLMGQGAH